MAKILACCANGSGTSLMMRLTLDKVIASCGFKVEEVRHDSIMEGRKIAGQYDIVLCRSHLDRSYNICYICAQA